MDITEKVRMRIKMLGVEVNEEVLEYSILKSTQQAADFCNISGVEYFPKDAAIYLIEYAAADYLIENCTFSPKWEKMRKDAEIGLMRFRRIRW